MLLLSASVYGLMVFSVCLIMKRIRYHNAPTPPVTIFFLIGALSFNHLIGQGVIGGQWDIAITQLAGTYIGFGCYLYVVGDIAYYRSQYRQNAQSNYAVRAPEDDPNWPNYGS
ncbi:MAG: hypothetical protein ABIR46_00780 [Candidatus Saccharimonadales bacterium]